ncbi:MAG: thioredoxin family protein, partial [Succinivibrio sp.]
NGTFKKSVFFGCCSALFTTPCTSAPLAGALIYVINSNSYTKGAILFFAIGLGMGIPLLLIGLFGGKVLNTFRSKTLIIKKLFALPLIAGAYMVVRHLTNNYTFIADLTVIALLSGIAVYICIPVKSLLKKGLMSLVTALVIVLAGVNFYKVKNEDTTSPFRELLSIEQLNDFKGQKILVTVSASWCSNCHELDSTVYKSREFAQMSRDYALVRFDFSEPSSELGEDLIDKFNLMGVPFLAVINEDGTIVSRKTGLVSLEELEELLK